MLYRIIAILFASLTCNAVSGAECGKECSAVATAPNAALEDVLVTGTFAPQPALTSSVSVLDAQQIQALNKTTVADLLKTLPGLLVEQQGGPGGLTAVSIRGGESNFTLVLVDGVAVNDPSNFRGAVLILPTSIPTAWSASRWCAARSPRFTVPTRWPA